MAFTGPKILCLWELGSVCTSSAAKRWNPVLTTFYRATIESIMTSCRLVGSTEGGEDCRENHRDSSYLHPDHWAQMLSHKGKQHHQGQHASPAWIVLCVDLWKEAQQPSEQNNQFLQQLHSPGHTTAELKYLLMQTALLFFYLFICSYSYLTLLYSIFT